MSLPLPNNSAIAMCELEAIRGQQEDTVNRIRKFIASDALSADLYSVEKELFRMVLSLGQSFLRELIARHSTGKVAKVVNKAGQRLPYQDNKTTTYLSIFGEIKICRAYYWLKGNEGMCPLDTRLNLPARRYSYLLDDWLQSAIVEEPYDKAVARFGKILGIAVSKLGQENVAREAGGKFENFYRQKGAFDEKTEGSHIGIEADGKGVRMISSEKPEMEQVRRGKGEKSGLRKMAVATADFTFNPQARTPEEMLKTLMRELPQQSSKNQGEDKPRVALNTTVAASMAGKQAALDSLIQRVYKRDPCAKKKIVVLMDGEPALEKQMIASLQVAGMAGRVDAFILDIMHAMEYLWNAGTALHGERARERLPWVRKHGLEMLKGNIGYVIGGLRITLAKRKLKSAQIRAINKSITYFKNHKHMMNYKRYLAAGYPVATGLIEGACGSLIKDRADRSGSRWSSIGVQAVLNERAITKNGDWEAFWNYHMKTEKERLYDQFAIENTKI